MLCDVQTDKAVVTMDIEEEGILAKILVIFLSSLGCRILNVPVYFKINLELYKIKFPHATLSRKGITHFTNYLQRRFSKK